MEREGVELCGDVHGVRLSIIIPTIGRRSLGKILAEILPQMDSDDEVLVVGDGRQPDSETISTGLDARIRYYEHGPTRLWGHPQRNWAMSKCAGSHIVSYDDDDAVFPHTLATIRAVARVFPSRPIIFKMRHGDGVLWEDPVVRGGNLSTQMLVVPNDPTRLGQWGGQYSGDFDFILSTVEKYPQGTDSVVWREEIIAMHGIGGVDPRPNMAGSVVP